MTHKPKKRTKILPKQPKPKIADLVEALVRSIAKVSEEKANPRRQPGERYSRRNRNTQKQNVIQFMNYHDMLHMVSDFSSHLMSVVSSEMTPIEREKLIIAGKEIFSVLQEKYEMSVPDAGALLMNLGVELLHELHVRVEKGLGTDEV